jgi:hypothetical protein
MGLSAIYWMRQLASQWLLMVPPVFASTYPAIYSWQIQTITVSFV